MNLILKRMHQIKEHRMECDNGHQIKVLKKSLDYIGIFCHIIQPIFIKSRNLLTLRSWCLWFVFDSFEISHVKTTPTLALPLDDTRDLLFLNSRYHIDTVMIAPVSKSPQFNLTSKSTTYQSIRSYDARTFMHLGHFQT